MNAGARRDKRAVGLILADLVVDVVSFVIVGSFLACWFHIGLAVKFKKKFVGRGPRVDKPTPFFMLYLTSTPSPACSVISRESIL